MKVSKLKGEELDYWVARAGGDASDGLAFIERHRIGLYQTKPHVGGKPPEVMEWAAMIDGCPDGMCTFADEMRGPTPLIAAMRAFVQEHFGLEVG